MGGLGRNSGTGLVFVCNTYQNCECFISDIAHEQIGLPLLLPVV
jgi:hypothetical protein